MGADSNEQYPTEVVDAVGSHPAEAYASLADLWDTVDFEDKATGEYHKFNEWADYFATEQSIELYDLLAEARNEIKHLKSNKMTGIIEIDN